MGSQLSCRQLPGGSQAFHLGRRAFHPGQDIPETFPDLHLGLDNQDSLVCSSYHQLKLSDHSPDNVQAFQVRPGGSRLAVRTSGVRSSCLGSAEASQPCCPGSGDTQGSLAAAACHHCLAHQTSLPVGLNNYLKKIFIYI